ncbi:MAG: ferredoxin family protein [Aquabacterium sp.]|jgi:NAD-dependent dihydropyrimidine dehydrogenase PreA subunit|nr:MAG: ferredoxin family protein [Aquabacterium sp.]
MISLLVQDRCTQCNRCVDVCPTNVFDLRADAPPAIARLQDCQTCFLCELYCPHDALFVDPDVDRAAPPRDPAELAAAGLLGRFRRDSGWDEWQGDPQYANQHWRMEEVFARGRDLAQQLAQQPPAKG